MAGIIQDNIMFPILELIREEIRKNNQRQSNTSVGADPFEGIPSTALYREHPLDPDVLTRVLLEYPSGYTMNIYLQHGLDAAASWPIGFDEESPDWEFVTNWLLRGVLATSLNTEGTLVASVQVGLNYDNNWRLVSTTVDKLY